MVYLFTGHETVVAERDSINPLSFDFVCDRETRFPHVMFGLQRTHANMKDPRIINRPGKRPASTDGDSIRCGNLDGSGSDESGRAIEASKSKLLNHCTISNSQCRMRLRRNDARLAQR